MIATSSLIRSGLPLAVAALAYISWEAWQWLKNRR
jgi:hypothetical protein